MSSLVFCERAKTAQKRKREALPFHVPPEALKDAKDAMGLPSRLMSGRELEITESSVTDLLIHLHTLDHNTRWTSVEVTSAFIKRACIAHQATNCLTDLFDREALERARQVDAYIEEHDRPLGPLAGLPVSLKDCFNVKGHDSTLGFVAWIDQAAAYDSLLVTILREAGAILYCKTNVPTAMMIAETLNNTWGRTLNPHNFAFTCGGSSGGEGSLIAMRGSPLGVGTDIGGSIRIPGALCGLYSLKPSFGRFPTMGSKSGMAGQESVNSINGPMANDIGSLRIFAKAIVDSEPWRRDPKCIPIPWRPIQSCDLPSKGMVFGMIKDDGCVHPTPPVVRALNQTRKALEKQGHTVIEWKVQDKEWERGSAILQTFFTMDGRRGIYDLMKAGNEHEKWVPGLGPVVEPKTVGESWAAQAVSLCSIVKSVFCSQSRCQDRWSWAAGILSRWEAMKGPDGRVMDAIIAPVTPHAGAEHDQFGRHVGYTGVWNIIDAPAVTVPILKADKELDAKESHQPVSFHCEDDEKIWAKYSAEKVHGLPTGLQIVGKRLEEEKLLAMAEIVADLVK